MSQLHENNFVKMTPLRNEVLTIVMHAKTPLSAYEILDKLREKRPSAEPPTVYRVLDFLVKQHAIHKIESTSKFIACSQVEYKKTKHQGVLFSCQQCTDVMEYADKNLSRAILNFCKQNTLIFNDSVVEIKGVCGKCSK